MPAYQVSRTILIEADTEAVFETIKTLKTWPAWSPWLIAEPETELSFAPDGQSYSWAGKIVGAGELTLTSTDAPHRLAFDLSIIKPFKSRSVTEFTMAPVEQGTRLTWTMNGRLPFFLFWMKPTLMTLIGMDYHRGLMMLKDFLERDGEVLSELRFDGLRDCPEISYLGIKGQCRFDEIGASMDRDFDTLFDYLSRFEQPVPEQAFGLYHDWNMKTGHCTYTVAVETDGQPSELDPGFVTGSLPTCRSYGITHTGAYRHVGNAWAAGMMRVQAKLFKQHKRHTPYEIYTNMVDAVDERSFETRVCLPVK